MANSRLIGRKVKRYPPEFQDPAVPRDNSVYTVLGYQPGHLLVEDDATGLLFELPLHGWTTDADDQRVLDREYALLQMES